MESIISTFHIDWKIIVAQAINFAVVFTVLYIFALKPLSKLMRERTEKIERGVSDAKQSSELLQRAAKEYEQNTIKLRQMSIEAQKELQKDLEQLRAKNLERIKADNDEWMKKRIEQMKIDKKALVREATSEVVALAMQSAEKLLGENTAKHLNEKAAKELNNL